MSDHEPLVQTLTVPVSAKARSSALAWAAEWETRNKSAAFRAIFRRGLMVALTLNALPEHPLHYEAKCSFRVPGYLLEMLDTCVRKTPGWDMTTTARTAFYLGLQEVQKDRQMVAQPKPPVARNREQMTLPL